MSASLDLPDADWLFIQLSGAWARERHVVSTPLRTGRQAVSSARGSAGHQDNPFIALLRPTTTEDAGEALGFSLVYSGNFLAEAEVDPHDTTRVRIGIDPETFSWSLEPGASFPTPEAVVAWSGAGLGALSDAYHRLYRERLARGPWRDRPRPVLLNNWEGTYFDFDEERILAIAAAGRDLGVELFVLDDGWFGKRDNDDSSLGDWFVDRRKLPNGIDGLARKVEALGIRFGLWIEPEMISERSRLFEEHPDWAIGIPGRHRTESRSQFVLDMSRPEVVDHLFDVLSDVLRGAPVSYVKWDYNRYITEPFSLALPADRQGEFFHRYILGLYDLYGRLTSAFPDILFESCAGGGGRFDPGLLAFAPQAWTSDDTDAVERLRIQWGTSLAYPTSSMAAHVSAVPNHQVGRLTSLATRAAVAFFGVFGYELDATAFRRRSGPRSPTRSPSTSVIGRSSSSAASSGSGAPSRATATRRPGCRWTTPPARRSSATTRCSPGRSRVRSGSASAASTRRPRIGSRPGRPSPTGSRRPTSASAAATSSCRSACSSITIGTRPRPAATSGRASSSSRPSRPHGGRAGAAGGRASRRSGLPATVASSVSTVVPAAGPSSTTVARPRSSGRGGRGSRRRGRPRAA